jgi:transcriptional regulator with XRE-family HTH domain
LRELREQAGLTLDEAAAQLEDISAAKISRIETAKVGVRPRDVEALLDVYRLHDTQRRTNLITLTRESRQRGWWQQFSDAIPPELDLAIGLEAEAVSIRIFSPHFVGGLFQTEAYARALLEANWTSGSPAQLARRVEVRMERQKILKERDGLEIRAVLDETVLSRPVGDYGTLRGQLRRLIELAYSPNVSIRVLPLSIGAHPGGEGPFRIIGLGPPDSPVVHLEYPDRAAYIEEESEVRLYADIFSRLEDLSMTSRQSLDLITNLGRKRNEP